MSDELKVREYAERERVTERTVRRWIEKGAVTIRRTPGGMIRVIQDRPGMSSADKSGQSSN